MGFPYRLRELGHAASTGQIELPQPKPDPTLGEIFDATGEKAIMGSGAERLFNPWPSHKVQYDEFIQRRSDEITSQGRDEGRSDIQIQSEINLMKKVSDNQVQGPIPGVMRYDEFLEKNDPRGYEIARQAKSETADISHANFRNLTDRAYESGGFLSDVGVFGAEMAGEMVNKSWWPATFTPTGGVSWAGGKLLTKFGFPHAGRYIGGVATHLQKPTLKQLLTTGAVKGATDTALVAPLAALGAGVDWQERKSLGLDEFADESKYEFFGALALAFLLRTGASWGLDFVVPHGGAIGMFGRRSRQATEATVRPTNLGVDEPARTLRPREFIDEFGMTIDDAVNGARASADGGGDGWVPYPKSNTFDAEPGATEGPVPDAPPDIDAQPEIFDDPQQIPETPVEGPPEGQAPPAPPTLDDALPDAGRTAVGGNVVRMGEGDYTHLAAGYEEMGSPRIILPHKVRAIVNGQEFDMEVLSRAVQETDLFNELASQLGVITENGELLTHVNSTIGLELADKPGQVWVQLHGDVLSAGIGNGRLGDAWWGMGSYSGTVESLDTYIPLKMMGKMSGLSDVLERLEVAGIRPVVIPVVNFMRNPLVLPKEGYAKGVMLGVEKLSTWNNSAHSDLGEMLSRAYTMHAEEAGYDGALITSDDIEGGTRKRVEVVSYGNAITMPLANFWRNGDTPNVDAAPVLPEGVNKIEMAQVSTDAHMEVHKGLIKKAHATVYGVKMRRMLNGYSGLTPHQRDLIINAVEAAAGVNPVAWRKPQSPLLTDEVWDLIGKHAGIDISNISARFKVILNDYPLNGHLDMFSVRSDKHAADMAAVLEAIDKSVSSHASGGREPGTIVSNQRLTSDSTVQVKIDRGVSLLDGGEVKAELSTSVRKTDLDARISQLDAAALTNQHTMRQIVPERLAYGMSHEEALAAYETGVFGKGRDQDEIYTETRALAEKAILENRVFAISKKEFIDLNDILGTKGFDRRDLIDEGSENLAGFLREGRDDLASTLTKYGDITTVFLDLIRAAPDFHTSGIMKAYPRTQELLTRGQPAFVFDGLGFDSLDGHKGVKELLDVVEGILSKPVDERQFQHMMSVLTLHGSMLGMARHGRHDIIVPISAHLNIQRYLARLDLREITAMLEYFNEQTISLRDGEGGSAMLKLNSEAAWRDMAREAGLANAESLPLGLADAEQNRVLLDNMQPRSAENLIYDSARYSLANIGVHPETMSNWRMREAVGMFGDLETGDGTKFKALASALPLGRELEALTDLVEIHSTSSPMSSAHEAFIEKWPEFSERMESAGFNGRDALTVALHMRPVRSLEAGIDDTSGFESVARQMMAERSGVDPTSSFRKASAIVKGRFKARWEGLSGGIPEMMGYVNSRTHDLVEQAESEGLLKGVSVFNDLEDDGDDLKFIDLGNSPLGLVFGQAIASLDDSLYGMFHDFVGKAPTSAAAEEFKDMLIPAFFDNGGFDISNPRFLELMAKANDDIYAAAQAGMGSDSLTLHVDVSDPLVAARLLDDSERSIAASIPTRVDDQQILADSMASPVDLRRLQTPEGVNEMNWESVPEGEVLAMPPHEGVGFTRLKSSEVGVVGESTADPFVERFIELAPPGVRSGALRRKDGTYELVSEDATGVALVVDETGRMGAREAEASYLAMKYGRLYDDYVDLQRKDGKAPEDELATMMLGPAFVRLIEEKGRQHPNMLSVMRLQARNLKSGENHFSRLLAIMERGMLTKVSRYERMLQRWDGLDADDVAGRAEMADLHTEVVEQLWTMEMDAPGIAPGDEVATFNRRQARDKMIAVVESLQGVKSARLASVRHNAGERTSQLVAGLERYEKRLLNEDLRDDIDNTERPDSGATLDPKDDNVFDTLSDNGFAGLAAIYHHIADQNPHIKGGPDTYTVLDDLLDGGDPELVAILEDFVELARDSPTYAASVARTYATRAIFNSLKVINPEGDPDLKLVFKVPGEAISPNDISKSAFMKMSEAKTDKHIVMKLSPVETLIIEKSKVDDTYTHRIDSALDRDNGRSEPFDDLEHAIADYLTIPKEPLTPAKIAGDMKACRNKGQ